MIESKLWCKRFKYSSYYFLFVFCDRAEEPMKQLIKRNKWCTWKHSYEVIKMSRDCSRVKPEPLLETSPCSFLFWFPQLLQISGSQNRLPRVMWKLSCQVFPWCHLKFCLSTKTNALLIMFLSLPLSLRRCLPFSPHSSINAWWHLFTESYILSLAVV